MKKIVLFFTLLISLCANSQWSNLGTLDGWRLKDPVNVFTHEAVIDSMYDPDYGWIWFTHQKSTKIIDLKFEQFQVKNLSDSLQSKMNKTDLLSANSIIQNSAHRFVSDTEKASWNTSLNLISGNGIAITGTYPNLTISVLPPTINVVSRSLNSNFTISTTKTSFVSYSVSCSATNPLLAGTSSAMAYLEYSLNGGSSWLLPSQSGNSNGVGVEVAIALTNTQTGTLTANIPANALVRIRTVTSGTATVTYITGTETTY